MQPWGERSAHCMILCQVDRLWQTLQLSIRTASKRWSQKQSQQSPGSNKWLNRWLQHAEWLRCLCGGAPCLYVSRWRKTGSISELWDQMARRRPSQERHFGLHVELIRIWSTDHQKDNRGQHHLQSNRSKNSLQTLSLRRKASLSSPLWEWASSNHTSCGFLHNLSYCEYTMETLGLNWVRLSYSHDLRVSLSQSQSMSWIVLVLCPVFLPKKKTCSNRARQYVMACLLHLWDRKHRIHLDEVHNEAKKGLPPVYQDIGAEDQLWTIHGSCFKPTSNNFSTDRWVMRWPRHALTQSKWYCYDIARLHPAAQCSQEWCLAAALSGSSLVPSRSSLERCTPRKLTAGTSWASKHSVLLVSVAQIWSPWQTEILRQRIIYSWRLQLKFAAARTAGTGGLR